MAKLLSALFWSWFLRTPATAEGTPPYDFNSDKSTDLLRTISTSRCPNLEEARFYPRFLSSPDHLGHLSNILARPKKQSESDLKFCLRSRRPANLKHFHECARPKDMRTSLIEVSQCHRKGSDGRMGYLFSKRLFCLSTKRLEYCGRQT